MIATGSRKDSTTRKDAPKTEQILFRVSAERKRQLQILLAARGQKFQAFFERILEQAILEVQKENN